MLSFHFKASLCYFCGLMLSISSMFFRDVIKNTVQSVGLLLCCTLLNNLSVMAQGNDCGLKDNTTASGQTCAITTAVPFLMICPDSRSGALGEAGVAIANNANGMYWNPASMPHYKAKWGFALNYTPWLRGLGIPDINHFYLPFYYNFGDKGGALGVSMTFFSLGEINLTNAVGQETGKINPSEYSFNASYAHKVTEHFSAGVSLRYIRSDLAGAQTSGGITTNPAQSFAGDIALFGTRDLGIKQSADDGKLTFSWGLNISNLGAKMSYTSTTGQRDFLPQNLRLGYGLRYYFDDANSIMFTNDFNKLLVPSAGGTKDVPTIQGAFESFGDAPRGFSEEISEINVSLGAEYNYDNTFMARAGYFYEDPNKGNRRFFTVGLGVSFKSFGLDGAFLIPITQNHPLQNTFRFTLNFLFGREQND